MLILHIFILQVMVSTNLKLKRAYSGSFLLVISVSKYVKVATQIAIGSE